MAQRTYHRASGPCIDCGRGGLWARDRCASCYSTWHRHRHGRKPTLYLVTCEHCGENAEVQKRGARYCSHECYIAARYEPSRAVEVWRPPLFRTPGPRWDARPTKHPSINGTLFVFGPCAWCSEPFMALAADWERRSLYCSKKCGRQAGRHRRGRFLVPDRVRQSIYERDGWVCQLCFDRVDADLHPSDPWAATLDHIVCRSWTLFPDDSPENLRLAHRWCNSVRGDEQYFTEEDLRCQA